MWCSKNGIENWHPISLKHLVIWILVLSILVFIVLIFGDQASAPFRGPSLFLRFRVYTERPPFSGLCVFRLVVMIKNDFPIGPEILTGDCFTPGLWLSVGDGSSSEDGTVEKWPFLDSKLLLKIWGSGPKEEEYQVGVKTTDSVREMTNSKDGFTGEKAF